jgi:hypothetical protein
MVSQNRLFGLWSSKPLDSTSRRDQISIRMAISIHCSVDDARGALSRIRPFT